MTEYGLPALYAALTWWFTTGVILWLDRLPQRTFRFSMLGASMALLVALYGLITARTDTTVAGAYMSFSCALVIWGWLEMSFLMGIIMGPRRHACPAHCSGWRHFKHAIEAILYHEFAIIFAAVVVIALSQDAPNQVGMWTFLLLWGMRQSAKLNLFFGVPNLGEQFLPQHLKYLQTFFNRRPMNFLFPLSITAGSVLTAWLIQQAAATAASDFETTAYALLATLSGLAMLEHWFMVLPLPSQVLWRWSMHADETSNSESRSISDPCIITTRPL